MIISVFNFSDYKRFLGDILEVRGKEVRGFRTKMANQIGCHPSYLSQVVNGKPDLTLEQAQRATQALSLDKQESRYFLLLVAQARSGTKELRQFFTEQLEGLKTSRFDLKQRMAETDDIPEAAKHRYYSTWFYAAIHICLAIPDFKDVPSIANRFRLPEDLVAEVIRFLVETGLVVLMNGRYELTKMRIHLDRNSEFVQRHHVNWRSQALQSTEKNLKDDLHFSTVFAITKDDFERIKEVFVTAIEDARKIIRPSESKELCAITLDAFKVV